MQELKEKVLAIVLKYKDKLAASGIQIDVSKRYFSTSVEERNTYYPNPMMRLLWNPIDRYFDKKREKKYGYNYENNKYHIIILTIIPVNNMLVNKRDCKDYAFVFRKTERAHIGEKPEQYIYKENSILSKIEKRIVKTLKKAKKATAQNVCRDTIYDAWRYTTSHKYGYKDKILDKDASSWDLLFTIVIGVFAIALVCVAWIFSSLI